jgi:hypothetical protein
MHVWNVDAVIAGESGLVLGSSSPCKHCRLWILRVQSARNSTRLELSGKQIFDQSILIGHRDLVEDLRLRL